LSKEHKKNPGVQEQALFYDHLLIKKRSRLLHNPTHVEHLFPLKQSGSVFEVNQYFLFFLSILHLHIHIKLLYEDRLFLFCSVDKEERQKLSTQLKQ
jgi:hypothetical protein